MTDVRLIDANALASYFLQLHMETDPLDNDWFTPYLLVKDAPTIDAVPVVRCRECRNSQKLKRCADQVYCMVWANNPRTDGYCYLGAKMDGGAEP